MELFDVIRYPVTDIFSDEINSYPKEIIDPWIRSCYSWVGMPEPGNILLSYSLLVQYIVIRTQLHADIKSMMLVGETCKVYFTETLKRCIKEYDEI